MDAFWRQVVRIALYLRSNGITSAQDRVVVYAFNSPEWVQWELGTWLSGGMSVGIHPSTSLNDLTTMFSLAKPKLVITESNLFRDRILQSRNKTPEQEFLTELTAVPEETGICEVKTFREMEQILFELSDLPEDLKIVSEDLLSRIDPSSAQIMVFTSGTTGVPKGVKLGLKQLTFVADCLVREWNLPFGEGVLFSFLPLSHIAEKIQTLAVAISQRYTVYFNSNSERVMEELSEVKPTLFCAVPRVWERMREEVESRQPKLLRRVMEFERVSAIAEKIYLSQVKEKLGLSDLVLAVSGAAKLSSKVGDWFEKLGIEIQEIYGMSEACGLITLSARKRNTKYSGKFSGVGSAPLGVEVKLNPDGEVLVKGDQVFLGYEDDADQTDSILTADGWLKTGDLGEWVERDGKTELQIIGRNREIIKLSNGRMIAPNPIENVIKEIPEISNACVIGEGRGHVMALLTLQEATLMEYKFVPGAIEGLSVEDEALKTKIRAELNKLFREGALSERVSHFVILSREFTVDHKELTATHKINRVQIEKNFQFFIQNSYEENL
jgi:long-chain acyl-CoA synthetase